MSGEPGRTMAAAAAADGEHREVGLRRVVVRSGGERRSDWVLEEEPLELRLDGEVLGVTLRTPGRDRELALGFLHGEGMIRERGDVLSVATLLAEGDDALGASVEVARTAAGQAWVEVREQDRRRFPVTSACGLCGRPSLGDLWQRIPALRPLALGERELLRLVAGLPARMRREQKLFARTGGAHGAALFDLDGRLLDVAEDIGRHNTVDKIVGHALDQGRLPLHATVLVVSGRAGFEIVQKSLAAAVPVVVAVGAASSLAIELAALGGQWLFSFAASGRANVHPPPLESSS